jgi:hypothetical protein
VIVDRLVVGGAVAGLVVSLGLHAATVAGVDLGTWSAHAWPLHVGVVVGFWYVAGRIAAAGLRGVAGLLRMRRMVPIPLRLALGAATVNAAITVALSLSRRAAPERAWSAYWCMMYLLVTIVAAFVLPRIESARVGTPR